MIPRALTSVVVVALALALACIDMSAPKGPASISNLRLPSPSLIVGDTMRDSTGTPAPLTLAAFDANMQPIVAQGAQFFITDTTKSAILTGSNFLIGVHLGATVVIGQIGNLQTAPTTPPVPVTNRPSQLVKTSGDSLFVVQFSGNVGDTTAATPPAVVSLNVLSDTDSASQGIIVRYTLTGALASRDPSRPAVIIADGNGKPGTVDTSQASGLSSRQIIVFPGLLADTALQHGNKIDTIIVQARASYARAELTNSPVTFNIPVTIKLVFSNP